MLRVLVGLLLLANLAFWALTQDEVVQALGLASGAQREPERLARQVRPEAVQVVRPAAPAGSGAASSADQALSCVETGPLNDAEAAAATRELQQAGVPAGAWVDMRRETPGRWLLYMGRFASAEQMRNKAVELQRMSLPYEELLEMPEYSPGLMLGDFNNAAEAQARLAQLRSRGVRTARVVQPTPPGAEHRLRVDRAAPPLRAQLQALAASTPRWAACAAP